jgi:hypothetical protein
MNEWYDAFSFTNLLAELAVTGVVEVFALAGFGRYAHGDWVEKS